MIGLFKTSKHCIQTFQSHIWAHNLKPISPTTCMKSCRWHAHTNSRPFHTHAGKQQRPFLFPSNETNHAWVGAADVSPFVPLHFRQLSRGTWHKRSQMYFLLAEVRKACHQTAIFPSNVGKCCNHPQQADGWCVRPWATHSDCCAHSPHAAQRQNGAQLNYKQIDNHVAPLSTAWSPRARIDSKADRLHFLPPNNCTHTRVMYLDKAAAVWSTKESLLEFTCIPETFWWCFLFFSSNVRCETFISKSCY